MAAASAGMLLLSSAYLMYKRATTPRHNPLDHVVLLRCKHNAWDEQNLKRRIEALAQSIPGVLDITCGPTYSTTRNSGFTHGLVVRLSSKEALATYAIHAKHLDVKAYILKSLQPLLTRESNDGSGAVTLPPVLAVDYHSTRYAGRALGQRSHPNSVSHVVLICLRPHCPTSASCRNMDQRLHEAAREMAEGIPGVCDLTFGRSFTTARSCGYTHCLNVRFESKEAGDLYQPHVLHSAFKKHLIGNFSRTLSHNMPGVLCLDWEGRRG